VGHVGVLYAPMTLREVTGWFRGTSGVAPDRSGIWTLILLAALLVLVWPISRLLRRDRTVEPPALSWPSFVLAVIAPAVVTGGAVVVVGGGGFSRGQLWSAGSWRRWWAMRRPWD